MATIAKPDDIINALDQILKTNITSLVVTFILAATVLLLLKIVAEALAGYIQFRLDRHIAIGSAVEIFGKVGRIKEISIFTITVETECGFIRTPTKTWRASRFLALKNVVSWDRRKEDKLKGK